MKEPKAYRAVVARCGNHRKGVYIHRLSHDGHHADDLERSGANTLMKRSPQSAKLPAKLRDEIQVAPLSSVHRMVARGITMSTSTLYSHISPRPLQSIRVVRPRM